MLGNGWARAASGTELYLGPGVSEDGVLDVGLRLRRPLEWGDALYSGPAVDYEAELMESRLQQRAHVYNNATWEVTKTQPHPLQPKEFSWSECLDDQMIPFQVRDLPSIVETLVTCVPCSPSYEALLVPSNGILLLARYAHSVQAPGLFDDLLNLAIRTIHAVVKERATDFTLLSFWLTNCAQLLYYLKKDHSLCVASIEQQVILPEVIYDAYSAVVLGTQAKLEGLLVPCMLEHDIIPGLDQVQFKDRKKAQIKGPARPSSPRQMPYSPRTLITLLDSLNHLFCTFQVHPAIVQRILAQIYWFVSTSLFNRVLDERRYCCRAKALQLRMNLSSLEHWARANFPSPGAALVHLSSLVQLLELLQCATHLLTVASFTETVKSWTRLTIGQANYALNQYFYEVEEPAIHPAILSLASSWASHDPNTLMPEFARDVPNPAGLHYKPSKLPGETCRANVFKNPSHMLAFGPRRRLRWRCGGRTMSRSYPPTPLTVWHPTIIANDPVS
ncbi:hypothetical protein L0F63_005556, partial [Massospora cicadina]